MTDAYGELMELTERQHNSRRAVLRDKFTCQRCGKRGSDVAHILPRGRFPELKAQLKNLVTLCRECHMATESVPGRIELIRMMQDKYGYTYDEPQYAGYLPLDTPLGRTRRPFPGDLGANIGNHQGCPETGLETTPRASDQGESCS